MIVNLDRIANFFLGISRYSKQSIVITIDAFYTVFTVWLSLSLIYDSLHIPILTQWYVYTIALLLALPIFIIYGLYRSIFRYSGFGALSSVIKACTIYGILYYLIVIISFPEEIPRSIGILQPILLLLAILSSRAIARFWFHPSSMKNAISCKKENLLIYGAGQAGIQIASALQHTSNYNVKGFIDDNCLLYGKNINGLTVYKPDVVKEIVENKKITSILIALPSATRSRRQEIIRQYDGLGIHIRMLPGMEAIADGKIAISDIREVEIEDILGRDPVSPDPELFEKCIKNKTVVVTGAGGSIGSELCRQIVVSKPSELILIEQSEYNLYALNHELEEKIKKNGYSIKLIPLLADVTDTIYIKKIFDRYHPETVYHAAAYKHVPLVEYNPLEGLRNNVFGTLSIAEASKETKVKNFILISTDKAVRPTNIMGASKRISELILQAMANEQNEDGTCFSMVRFGNVLGSSGSVVPLFKSQIKNGGPITVTHQDITRYFMTIPEAAQLVIQAGAMASGGDVFLLEMGEPVRIIDLAKRMIELSGFSVRDNDNTGGDLEIKVTGLRPGEKLYEELLISDNPIKTNHPRIFKAHETYISLAEIREYLRNLEYMIESGNSDINDIKTLIKKIVKGYQANGKVSEVLEKKDITVKQY